MEDSSSNSSSDDSCSSSTWKGGRVAYCTALLMRSLLIETAGSNPVPSSNMEGTVKVTNQVRTLGEL